MKAVQRCTYKLLHELSLLVSIVFVASWHISPE